MKITASKKTKLYFLGSQNVNLITFALFHVLCIYSTTLGVRPCLDRVISTSPALFLHATLLLGHQLVIALNSRFKSSFRASSSAGDT